MGTATCSLADLFKFTAVWISFMDRMIMLTCGHRSQC